MSSNLVTNIILDQFDKIYFPKKIKCSNFYDVLLYFKNVVSFTGTPFIYPTVKLISELGSVIDDELEKAAVFSICEPTDK
jgi:hypothetical protein